MWLIQTYDKSSTSRRPNIRSPNPCEINGVQYFSLGSAFTILAPCNACFSSNTAVYHNQSQLLGKLVQILWVMISFLSFILLPPLPSSTLSLSYLYLIPSFPCSDSKLIYISITQMAEF
jgi:hypothetical protein